MVTKFMQIMPLEVIKGDLFKSITNETRIMIPHVCNDIGAFGAGFVVSLSKFNKDAEKYYRLWFQDKTAVNHPLVWTSRRADFSLGESQIVQILGAVYVANMIGQRGIISSNNRKPIRYAALIKCMENVADFCVKNKCEIRCPRFGSGLAGGDVRLIEELMREIWVDVGVSVKVYEL